MRCGFQPGRRLLTLTDREYEGFEALLALPDKERDGPQVLGWDLGRVERLLTRLGRPQDSFTTILVAGSKGKGSTAAMLASVLQAAGLRVGLYTQPHLHRYAERLAIDGLPIPPSDAQEGLRRILSLTEEPITAFEAATALAALWFAERGVGIAVVEVGLGGRLDATAVLVPAAVAWTPIEREHTDVLGDGLASVAAHEAAIWRPGAYAFSAPQEAEVAEVLSCLPVSFVTGPPPVRPSLRGGFQQQNAALAAACATALGVSAEAVVKGLTGVRWPGRFELIAERPTVVVDGAHTPMSARALASALREEFGDRPTALIIGAAADKDLQGMAAALRPQCGAVFAVQANHPRARPASEVAAAFEGLACRSIAEALVRAIDWAGPSGVVCAAGSLRVAAAVRALVLGLS